MDDPFEVQMDAETYAAIDRYALSRLADGSLYGWGPAENGAARLIVRHGSGASFPTSIRGVIIHVIEIEEPRLL
jgi:hypothetical protein